MIPTLSVFCILRSMQRQWQIEVPEEGTRRRNGPLAPLCSLWLAARLPKSIAPVPDCTKERKEDTGRNTPIPAPHYSPPANYTSAPATHTISLKGRRTGRKHMHARVDVYMYRFIYRYTWVPCQTKSRELRRHKTEAGRRPREIRHASPRQYNVHYQRQFRENTFVRAPSIEYRGKTRVIFGPRVSPQAKRRAERAKCAVSPSGR